MVATPSCNAGEAALAHITKLKIKFYRPTYGGLHAAFHMSKTAQKHGQLIWETPSLMSTESPVDPMTNINDPRASDPLSDFSIYLMKGRFHLDAWKQVMMNLHFQR